MNIQAKRAKAKRALHKPISGVVHRRAPDSQSWQPVDWNWSWESCALTRHKATRQPEVQVLNLWTGKDLLFGGGVQGYDQQRNKNLDACVRNYYSYGEYVHIIKKKLFCVKIWFDHELIKEKLYLFRKQTLPLFWVNIYSSMTRWLDFTTILDRSFPTAGTHITLAFLSHQFDLLCSETPKFQPPLNPNRDSLLES